MSIYLIALNEPNAAAWTAVRDKWPARHYILTDHMAFVAPEGIVLTQEIADALGINSERRISGFVVELNNYSGLSRAALKEWIGKVE